MFQEMLQCLVNIAIFTSMLGRTRLGTETKEYFKTAFYSQIVSVLLENEFLKKPISSMIEEQLKDVQKECEQLKKDVKLLKELLENSGKNEERKSLEKHGLNINFSLENYCRSNGIASLCQVGKNGQELVTRTRDIEEFSLFDNKEVFLQKNLDPCSSERSIPNQLNGNHDIFKRKENILNENTVEYNNILVSSKFIRDNTDNRKALELGSSVRSANEIPSLPTKSTFFATYFSLNTTRNELETYLRDRLGTAKVCCEEIIINKKRIAVNQKKKYKSFKVDVDRGFGNALYNPDVWPEGIVVKKFRKFKI